MSALSILQTIEARLKTVLIANGYNTNAGQRVSMGSIWLDEDEFPALTLHEGAPVQGGYSLVRSNGRAGSTGMKMRAEYTVEGFADCSSVAPYVAGHALIADIKRALFANGGLTLGTNAGDHVMEGHGIMPRAQGSNRIAVAVVGSYFYIDEFKPV